MGYHVLQQFNEQWLAEIRGGRRAQSSAAFRKKTAEDGCATQPHPGWLTLTLRQWIVLGVALLIAAFALLLAQDAERRADDLQQRLAAHEREHKN